MDEFCLSTRVNQATIVSRKIRKKLRLSSRTASSALRRWVNTVNGYDETMSTKARVMHRASTAITQYHTFRSQAHFEFRDDV